MRGQSSTFDVVAQPSGWDSQAKAWATVFLLATSAWAGTPGSSAGETLRLVVNPRAAALGGALAAFSDGVLALEGNPAGLGWLQQTEGVAMHAEWLAGVQMESLAAVGPIRGGGAGWFLNYLHLEDLSRRGAQGGDLGRFGFSDLVVRVGWGGRLAERLAIGGAVTSFSELIDNISGSAVAVDLGVQARPTGPLTLGAAVQHLGTTLTVDQRGVALPLTVRTGLAFRLKTRVTRREAFALSLEGSASKGADTDLRAGLELWPVGAMALRAGYRTRFFEGALGGLTGFSGGIGLRPGAHWLFDYAFAPFGLRNGFGLTHRASLGYRFGSETPARLARTFRDRLDHP